MEQLVSPRSSLRCRPRWATRRTERPSLGPRAARWAAVLGQPVMDWQRDVLDVALELDPDTGLPAYRQVGVTVPRRSGKTTLLLALTIDRCSAGDAGSAASTPPSPGSTRA